MYVCFSFQCLTNICSTFSSFFWQHMAKYNENLLAIIAHWLQLSVYEAEKPYASPTTHFRGSVISDNHRNRVNDMGKGSSGCFPCRRLAHVGEISLKDKGFCSGSSSFISLHMSSFLFIDQQPIIIQHNIKIGLVTDVLKDSCSIQVFLLSNTYFYIFEFFFK